MAKTVEQTIELKPIKIETIMVKIVGDTELITHRWSEKAKKEMLAAQQKRKEPKAIRDPEQEYLSGLYYMSKDTYGFPAIGIKAAMINVAHKDMGLEKTRVRKAIFIPGTPSEFGEELIEIHGKPRMREDMIRLSSGTSDLRYRPGFMPWSMNVTIKYNTDFITAESAINLLNLAGFCCGIGEWRPERDGQFGMFHTDNG